MYINSLKFNTLVQLVTSIWFRVCAQVNNIHQLHNSDMPTINTHYGQKPTATAHINDHFHYDF